VQAAVCKGHEAWRGMNKSTHRPLARTQHWGTQEPHDDRLEQVHRKASGMKCPAGEAEEQSTPHG
jgi:hypothetical protein